MSVKRLFSGIVEASWLDALGHVNFLEHQRIADKATDQLWLEVGGEPPSATVQLAFIIVETHVRYERELRLHDHVGVDTRVIAYDHRRIHLLHTIVRDCDVISVVQVLGLAFNAHSRRASRWSELMLKAFEARLHDAPAESVSGLMDWKLRTTSS
jgi:acyl-CoA thioester hydrolase